MNAGEGSAGSRGSVVVLSGIWLLAVCFRLVYLWQIHDAVFFDLRIGDAEAYHLWARRIAAGDWLGQGVFYQAPLYPYFLAIIYRVLGDGAGTVRLVQAGMGGLSCALLAQAGISLFGQRGALAGVLLAVYPAAIFLDGSLEKSALATLLITALLALLSGLRGPRETRAIWGAGMILALFALTRENALVLALPILMWLGLRRRTLLFVAACGLILLPVALRNLVVGGEFHLTTAQFGPNFYIGNRAGASGTYQALVTGHGNAVDEREDATRLAEQAAGRKLSAGSVSRYWTGRALAYMLNEPAAWLGLMVRKTALTFNAAEVSDTESQEVYVRQSWLLRLLRTFDFGVVLALAVMGTALAADRREGLWLLWALVGAYAASLVLFYVLARYRFPLVPPLMLIGTGAFLQFLDRKRFLVAVLAALAVVAFAHLPLDDPRSARATHYANIAAALTKDPARVSGAREYYRRALEEDPKFPPALFGMGTLLARAGQHDEAMRCYRAAVEARPDYAAAKYNLGLSLAALGRVEEAAGEYAAALELVPGDVDARLALGKALVELHRSGEAIQHYQTVLAIEPDNVGGRVGLGVSLAQSGRVEEGAEQFQLALAADPKNASAHNSLGVILASGGRISEALPHFEKAVALNPDDENAKRNLVAARDILSRR